MKRFNRFYQIVFKLGYLKKVGAYDKAVVENEVVVSNPLTAEFAISRSVYSQTNTAFVTIYGLAQETREQIYKDRDDTLNYIEMDIYAGYADFNALIFSGHVKECMSGKDSGGTEFVTQVEAWDGGLSVFYGEDNNSFDKGVKKEFILETLCNNMPAIDVGAISPKYAKETTLRPVTLSHKTYEDIKTMTDGNLFIDLNKIYMLDEDEVIDGNIDFLDLKGTLLGTPERRQGIISIEVLFEPRIMVGQWLDLVSEGLPYLNGRYKVLGVEHNGIISDAKCGSMITKIDLFIGTHIFRRVNKKNV